MTFYFDACLSKRIVKVLKYLDVDAIGPEDVFRDASIDDVVWLPVASKNGWAILTSDRRIRKNPGEREIFEALDCITIFMYERYVRQELFAQVSYITKHWEKIEKTATHAKPKTSFRMKANGQIMESEEYVREQASRNRRKRKGKRKR